MNSFLEKEASFPSCREVCLETSIQEAILCTVNHLDGTINPSDGVKEEEEDYINADITQNGLLNRSI